MEYMGIINGWDGIKSFIIYDMPSMLQLSSIEMDHNTQLQEQEENMDDQCQQMMSAQSYLLTNNLEEVVGTTLGSLHNYLKNPFEDS